MSKKKKSTKKKEEEKLKISNRFIVICGILYLLIIFLSVNSMSLKYRTSVIAKKLDQDKLYDTNGKINLTQYKEKKNTLENELKELINNNSNIKDYQDYIDTMKKDNLSYNNQIEKLNVSLNELETKKGNLSLEYNTLNKKYQQILNERRAKEEEERRKNIVLIKNVPTISQYPNYPTGCESVALTLLLRYYGVSVSPDNVISNLRKGDLPYNENGVLYGGNPELEFIGNPYWANSYGVYNNPIANVANIYKSGAIVKTNFPFSEVLNLINQNKPVVVWTSMHLAVPYISRSWIYKPTGEKISWKSNEHAVLVVGYNSYYVVISDPLTGTIRYQDRSTFESRYNYYGKRAVYYA